MSSQSRKKVYVMNACEVIKDSKHCVEHDDNLHAITLATDVEKSWDVVEHYGHLIENLNRKETRVWSLNVSYNTISTLA